MGNVVLINPFEVPAERGEQFLAGWSQAAEYMLRQPGFAGTRLHQAMAPQAKFGFVNLAEWATPRDFQAAVSTAEFEEMTKGGPPSYPALYEVVRTIEPSAS